MPPAAMDRLFNRSLRFIFHFALNLQKPMLAKIQQRRLYVEGFVRREDVSKRVCKVLRIKRVNALANESPGILFSAEYGINHPPSCAKRHAKASTVSAVSFESA